MKFRSPSFLWCYVLAMLASPAAAQSRFADDVYTIPRAGNNPFTEKARSSGHDDRMAQQPILRLRDPAVIPIPAERDERAGRSQQGRRVNWEANTLALTGPDTTDRSQRSTKGRSNSSRNRYDVSDRTESRGRSERGFYVAEAGDDASGPDIGLDDLEELSADEILERAEQAADEETRKSEATRKDTQRRTNTGRSTKKTDLLDPLSDDELGLDEEAPSDPKAADAYVEPTPVRGRTNAKNGFWANAASQPMTLGEILGENNYQDQCREQQFCQQMWACAPPPDECALDSWKRDKWRTYNTCMVGRAGCGPMGFLWLPGEGVIPGIPRVVRVKGGLLGKFGGGGHATGGSCSDGCCDDGCCDDGCCDDGCCDAGSGYEDGGPECGCASEGCASGGCANGQCALGGHGGTSHGGHCSGGGCAGGCGW